MSYIYQLEFFSEFKLHFFQTEGFPPFPLSHNNRNTSFRGNTKKHKRKQTAPDHITLHLWLLRVNDYLSIYIRWQTTPCSLQHPKEHYIRLFRVARQKENSNFIPTNSGGMQGKPSRSCVVHRSASLNGPSPRPTALPLRQRLYSRHRRPLCRLHLRRKPAPAPPTMMPAPPMPVANVSYQLLPMLPPWRPMPP
jgi:hypothetical protein